MNKQKIILIAGPTATGKSALALDLAQKTGGAIINADAMQIYAGLPVLTAQPSVAERKKIPHELYGTLDPGENSSAGTWLKLAQGAIEKALKEKCIPILVGGTGLYFKALLGGLAAIPAIPKTVRAAGEKLYDELGEQKFRAWLARRDPDTARRVAKNDRQRLIRAYEVVTHTGQPLLFWHAQTSPGYLDDFKVESHLVMPERDELYAACDARFTQMIEAGAIEEAKKFLARKLDPALPAMKTIGLREIGAYLKGDITLDEAVAKGRQATRNYAKRQMTWFRNQWIAPLPPQGGEGLG